MQECHAFQLNTIFTPLNVLYIPQHDTKLDIYSPYVGSITLDIQATTNLSHIQSMWSHAQLLWDEQLRLINWSFIFIFLTLVGIICFNTSQGTTCGKLKANEHTKQIRKRSRLLIQQRHALMDEGKVKYKVHSHSSKLLGILWIFNLCFKYLNAYIVDKALVNIALCENQRNRILNKRTYSSTYTSLFRRV